MFMTLHAMPMIHIQNLGPGYYGGKKELTSKYRQTCKPVHGEQNPEILYFMQTRKPYPFLTV